MQQQESFSEADRRWKCLRDGVHVTEATKAIGWLGIAFTLLVAIFSLSLGTTKQADEWIANMTAGQPQRIKAVLVGATAVWALLSGLTASCTLHAAYGERREFLVPHLVMLNISIILSILFSLISFAYRFFGLFSYRHSHVADFLFVISLIAFAISVWLLDVVYSCYRDLGAKEQHDLLGKTADVVHYCSANSYVVLDSYDAVTAQRNE